MTILSINYAKTIYSYYFPYYNKTIVNNTLTALSGKGVNAQTLDGSSYWTSLEYSNGTIYMVYLSNGRRSETNRATTANVRPSLEF